MQVYVNGEGHKIMEDGEGSSFTRTNLTTGEIRLISSEERREWHRAADAQVIEGFLAV